MPSGKRKLKRRLGGGNEAEEVQTPDVEFDKNCFNEEFNKTVYVRIARERETERDPALGKMFDQNCFNLDLYWR